VLKVLRRHQLLTLAIPRQITPREAAQELKDSLAHANKLLKRLRKTGRTHDNILLLREGMEHYRALPNSHTDNAPSSN